MVDDSRRDDNGAGLQTPIPEGEAPTLTSRIRRVVFGAPRDLGDRQIFHHISLIPVLAWIGLGSDGLSSSSYGPHEAYWTLSAFTDSPETTTLTWRLPWQP